jgi:hypothetical protein
MDNIGNRYYYSGYIFILSTYIIEKITQKEFIYHEDKSIVFAFIIFVNTAFMYVFKTYAGLSGILLL